MCCSHWLSAFEEQANTDDKLLATQRRRAYPGMAYMMQGVGFPWLGLGRLPCRRFIGASSSNQPLKARIGFRTRWREWPGEGYNTVIAVLQLTPLQISGCLSRCPTLHAVLFTLLHWCSRSCRLRLSGAEGLIWGSNSNSFQSWRSERLGSLVHSRQLPFLPASPLSTLPVKAELSTTVVQGSLRTPPNEGLGINALDCWSPLTSRNLFLPLPSPSVRDAY